MEESTELKKLDLSDIGHELFEGREAESFTLRYGDNELQLILHDIKLYPDSTPGEHATPSSVRAQPFSLGFRGPVHPALEHGSCAIEHPEIGSMDPVYLSCYGQTEEQRYYSVEFN